MRVFRNIILIAGLVSMGACTVVVDPSSGSSAASSGGSSSSGNTQQTSEFAHTNLDRLKSDMAAGYGEYLGTLAALLNIEPVRQAEFFAFTQNKFTVLFPNERTTADEMLTTLNREMKADPRFNPQLALN